MASRARLFHNALLVLLLAAASSDDQDVTQYVDWLEAQVQEIAKQAVENDDQSCELLKTCEGNCSRHTCTPPPEDFAHLDKFSCISVPQNEECNAFSSNKSCQEMRVSLSKSYVILPSSIHEGISDPVKEPPSYITRIVCAQRMLDPLFQKIWNESKYEIAWMMFGSSYGVHRYFPGREWSQKNCTTYDPRKRPWYLAVTSILKDLVILLDYSFSMKEVFSYASNETRYSVAAKITLDLLETLSIGDQITTLRFDTRNTTRIFKKVFGDPENSTIMGLLRKETPEETETGQPDLSLAITKAVLQFNNDSSLKIIMIFTYGNVKVEKTVQEVPNNILMFIYILGFHSDYDLNSLAPLQSNSSTIVSINDTNYLQDPLLAIQSFFDVMAQIKFQTVGGKPYWVQSFGDKGGLGRILSVIYPVFDNSTRLIGVAGIEQIVLKLPAGFDSIISKRPGSNPSQLPSKYRFQFTTQDNKQCNTQSSTAFCDGKSSYDYLELLCCGMCQAKYSTSLSLRVILVISVCCVSTLLSMIAIVRCVLIKVRGKTFSRNYPQEVTSESGDPISGSNIWSIAL